MPGTSAAAKKAWVTRRANEKGGKPKPKPKPKKTTPKKSGKKSKGMPRAAVVGALKSSKVKKAVKDGLAKKYPAAAKEAGYTRSK